MNLYDKTPYSKEVFDIKAASMDEKKMRYVIENHAANLYVTFRAETMLKLMKFFMDTKLSSFRFRSNEYVGAPTLLFNRDKQNGILTKFAIERKSYSVYFTKENVDFMYEVMRSRWMEKEGTKPELEFNK
ncbi:hypothetical protein CN918_31280 [Priestia megaterium]|nr:hypothetical protein CN918_31280 [Priestia megaterium]